MEENYCALFIAIVLKCTVEQAFEFYEKGKGIQRAKDVDDSLIYAYRSKGMTNQQVGDLFGISLSAVSKRYNKYKKSV